MARRSLRGVLLHINLNPAETNVDTLLTMLDHFHEHPEDYKEIIYDSI